ncbi:WXG100 family type VII secretion target [Streptomyces sp. SAI-133]|uniref:WXG100 family type VII secretion target n=1 Tax=Streptomyces sp. SAI-133 TaxID=2940547 RepID=UPI0024767F1B|nr:WXG100 family type VII secretion target [Streptomyces sp. SAI-133]MDH6581411.1 WXG100 family type VII secretion target [Streptomyces sp. SAI-133]
MADGIIDVQYTVARQAIEDLRAQTQQIASVLHNLEDELQPLIASWEGDDQEMYRQVQMEWNQATSNMGTLLDQTGHLLTSIHDGHIRDERKSVDGWQSVRAR